MCGIATTKKHATTVEAKRDEVIRDRGCRCGGMVAVGALWSRGCGGLRLSVSRLSQCEEQGPIEAYAIIAQSFSRRSDVWPLVRELSEEFVAADGGISRRLWLDEVKSVRILSYHVGVRRKRGAEQGPSPAGGQKCLDGVQQRSAALRLDTNTPKNHRKAMCWPVLTLECQSKFAACSGERHGAEVPNLESPR